MDKPFVDDEEEDDDDEVDSGGDVIEFCLVRRILLLRLFAFAVEMPL